MEEKEMIERLHQGLNDVLTVLLFYHGNDNKLVEEALETLKASHRQYNLPLSLEIISYCGLRDDID